VLVAFSSWGSVAGLELGDFQLKDRHVLAQFAGNALLVIK
jgi:hypothetical protein